jgi:hypothetical protein
MTTRTVGAWAFILAAGSLAGCASPGAFKNVPPQPTAATATPATNTGWARQTPAATKPQGDPSAIAAPMGNTPQFSNQPAIGIGPAGGLAPPIALPSISNGPAPTVPAAPAPGASTSNLIPVGASINGLSAGTPVSAAPAPPRQVAVNAARSSEVAPRVNIPVPAAPAEDGKNGPTMPPASAVSEPALQPPQPITQLSPVTLGTAPPTTVRQ